MTSADTDQYTYYVAYNFANTKGSGFGGITISFDHPITTPNQITELGTFISTHTGLGNVVILNFQLLSGPAQS